VDIGYRGPAPDWSRLALATVIEAGEGVARLRVGGDADVAAVLAAVLDRAGLVSFSYQPPTLSELFRQAVAA
jgi:ABC-2 type transport system ATP-binding protein